MKALIFVGLTLPILPFTVNQAINVPTLPIILTMFCNSTLFSLIWPLSIFMLNLTDTLKRKPLFEGITLSVREKVLLLFTARRITLEELEQKKSRYFPAETVTLQENKPTRKLVHLMKSETNQTKHTDNLKKHAKLYQKGVLASPTIPSITFFTLALAITPLGNIIFWLTNLFTTTIQMVW